jgi:hypothetical protein
MTNKPSDNDFLNRYTTLPVLLDMLFHKRLVLSSPANWEDRNDAFFIEQYKIKKKLQTTLALCFSGKPETFHHWKVFAAGPSGVNIQFDKARLVKSLRRRDGFLKGDVDYRSIVSIEETPPKVEHLPFLKRVPYTDEHEFRIIYVNPKTTEKVKCIPLDLTAIRRITLSPWLSEEVGRTVSHVIRNIEGCSHLRVGRSTLLENERWKSVITKPKATSKARAKK